MAERKAVNKYYPPEWDPSKGSVNRFQGVHPLRERARKLHLGILIVRFELPFNIWCEGCGKHVGMGVRYNAEKKKIGNYFSTPIFSFRMKCHLCSNWFEIQTDPKNSQYVVVGGARRKVETWDPEENETMVLKDDEKADQLLNNAFFKLEHDLADVQKAQVELPRLTELQQLNDKYWEDPYTQSQRLRHKFRLEKKKRLLLEEKDQAILKKNGLDLLLLPESAEDSKLVEQVKFATATSTQDPWGELKRARKQVELAPLFKQSKRGDITARKSGDKKIAVIDSLLAAATKRPSLLTSLQTAPTRTNEKTKDKVVVVVKSNKSLVADYKE